MPASWTWTDLATSSSDSNTPSLKEFSSEFFKSVDMCDILSGTPKPYIARALRYLRQLSSVPTTVKAVFVDMRSNLPADQLHPTSLLLPCVHQRSNSQLGNLQIVVEHLRANRDTLWTSQLVENRDVITSIHQEWRVKMAQDILWSQICALLTLVELTRMTEVGPFPIISGPRPTRRDCGLKCVYKKKTIMWAMSTFHWATRPLGTQGFCPHPECHWEQKNCTIPFFDATITQSINVLAVFFPPLCHGGAFEC